VDRVALHQMLTQDVGGPNAELGAAQGVHPVADRDDHVQVVEVHLANLSIGGNLCIFCTGCIPWQFASLIDVTNVPDDDSPIPSEQLRHLVGIQPYCLPFQPYIQHRTAISSLVKQHFSQCFIHFCFPIEAQSSIGTIPLQLGNAEQPQNDLPALLPILATRRTMAPPQRGQAGDSATRAATAWPEALAFAVRTDWIMTSSLSPSISSMFLSLANSLASAVNRPEVTT